MTGDIPTQALPPNPNDPLRLLRSHPQLNQLRRLAQSNPASLQGIIQELINTNPSLRDVISNNQQEFVALLNEPVQAEQEQAEQSDLMQSQEMIAELQRMATLTPAQQNEWGASLGLNPAQVQEMLQVLGQISPEQHRAFMEGVPGVAGQQQHPNTQTIQLTQPEMDAVNRLQELGFSQQEVVQAYLACDKNEELAANFLLSNQWD